MKRKRRYTQPTSEVLQDIRRLTNLGYSAREISGELGCCEESVKRWRKKYHIHDRYDLQSRVADFLNNSDMRYFSIKDVERHLKTRSREIDYFIKKLGRLGYLQKSGRKWKIVKSPIPRWIDYSQNTILPASNIFSRKVKVRA